MRVLLISPYAPNTAGSLRYRWEQYLPDFERAGIEIDIRGFQSLAMFNSDRKLSRVVDTIEGMFRHWRTVLSAGKYDVVVVQREIMPIGPPIFERWLTRQRIPFIYDYDDALYAKYSLFASGFRRRLSWPDKTKEIIKLSDQVIAGSPTLLNYARRYNNQVSLIPTVPYPSDYPVPEKRPKDYVTIGWSGGRIGTGNLNEITEALKQLSQTHAIKVHVAGNSQFRLDGVDVTAIDWRFPMDDKQVWQELKDFDIGLMPLQDTELNRGKCGFKALLYMSMGIPPIISPVGVNTDIVQDGANGFLATTQDEWYSKLKLLIEDSELRQQLGANARRSVEEKWSAFNELPQLINLLKDHAQNHASHTSLLQ